MSYSFKHFSGAQPSGTVTITANGTYDVTEKASAVVNVSGGSLGEVSFLSGKQITSYSNKIVNQSGLYMAKIDFGADYAELGNVTVAVSLNKTRTPSQYNNLVIACSADSDDVTEGTVLTRVGSYDVGSTPPCATMFSFPVSKRFLFVSVDNYHISVPGYMDILTVALGTGNTVT